MQTKIVHLPNRWPGNPTGIHMGNPHIQTWDHFLS